MRNPTRIALSERKSTPDRAAAQSASWRNKPCSNDDHPTHCSARRGGGGGGGGGRSTPRWSTPASSRGAGGLPVKAPGSTTVGPRCSETSIPVRAQHAARSSCRSRWAQDAGTGLQWRRRTGLTLLNDRTPVNAETSGPSPRTTTSIGRPVRSHSFRGANNGPRADSTSAMDLSADGPGTPQTIDGRGRHPPHPHPRPDLQKRTSRPSLRRPGSSAGGNGRALFQPGASATKWTVGAGGLPGVERACASRDVLERAGVKPSAV